MKNEIYKEALEVLNSKEFDSLLESAEFMAQAQGNLYRINRTVSELKALVNEGRESIYCGGDISNIVDSMEILINDISKSVCEEL